MRLLITLSFAILLIVQQWAVATEQVDLPTEQVCELDAQGECIPAIFEPTSEWKEILPNQAIPGGLHVRINLSTGKKEAKLLDNDKNDKIVENTVDVDGFAVAQTSTQLVAEELSTSVVSESQEEQEIQPVEESERIAESLYNVLASLPEPPVLDGMNIQQAYSKLSKEEFAAYISKLWKARQAELKEASEAIRNEGLYMQNLIDTLLSPAPDANTYAKGLLSSLEKLEWEVQDIDKARDFNTMGGLFATIQLLNSSDLEVRSQAAWVVGSAIKHFQDAQTWALEAGAMPPLLDALSTINNSKQHFNMQRKALYALSALLQHNTKCQSVFVQNEGVTILTKLAGATMAPTPLRLKALLALHHLLVEYQHDQSNSVLAEINSVIHSSSYCTVARDVLNPSLSPKQALQVMEIMVETLASPPSRCNQVITGEENIEKVKEYLGGWTEDIDEELKEEIITVASTLLEYIQARVTSV
ncbi:hypothetical protein THRCLA_20425 [Thraustotheca clavata]|uniref:Nucleotide exchange factor SIL1 n=1 Tax=Thraustotheca clavata TaxID=74557 RepID=A0A1W0A7I5_9STRA|nr:hypothetical protein THRCLA_20425 [Thraustotheca clavata]